MALQKCPMRNLRPPLGQRVAVPTDPDRKGQTPWVNLAPLPSEVQEALTLPRPPIPPHPHHRLQAHPPHPRQEAEGAGGLGGSGTPASPFSSPSPRACPRGGTRCASSSSASTVWPKSQGTFSLLRWSDEVGSGFPCPYPRLRRQPFPPGKRFGRPKGPPPGLPPRPPAQGGGPLQKRGPGDPPLPKGPGADDPRGHAGPGEGALGNGGEGAADPLAGGGAGAPGSKGGGHGGRDPGPSLHQRPLPASRGPEPLSEGTHGGAR